MSDLITTASDWSAWVVERIQKKHAPVKTGVDPVFRPNARQNKDVEHVRDSFFCERALGRRNRSHVGAYELNNAANQHNHGDHDQ